MASDLALAAAAAGGFALLASMLAPRSPLPIDRWVRRRSRTPALRRASKVMAPLFLAGLPGGYITVAYVLAHALRRRRRAGGPAIVTAAWAGWLVHRGAKLVLVRERPKKSGARRRMDSYPSGHTTGTTALAVTVARILARERLISNRRALALELGAPLVMGVYRVLDDEHWATDVLGGWLLGSSIALVCDALLSELGGARPTREQGERLPAARPRVRPARSTSST
ncbi:MAG TPA: phosphatase PAP2 family protein [Gemmatimonadaceae bacterium]|nr:phosphatase PAP2 family protein [Gemmatimonadaceae bacterium]